MRAQTFLRPKSKFASAHHGDLQLEWVSMSLFDFRSTMLWKNIYLSMVLWKKPPPIPQADVWVPTKVKRRHQTKRFSCKSCYVTQQKIKGGCIFYSLTPYYLFLPSALVHCPTTARSEQQFDEYISESQP